MREYRLMFFKAEQWSLSDNILTSSEVSAEMAGRPQQ